MVVGWGVWEERERVGGVVGMGRKRKREERENNKKNIITNKNENKTIYKIIKTKN